LPNRPNLTLDKYSFPLAICVQDDFSNTYFNPKYFTLEAQIITISIGENGTASDWNENYEIVPCQPDHFPSISNDTFFQSGLNNYYCFDDQNFTVGGFFDNQYTRYTVLSLKRCINSTENSDICAPVEEIESFFKDKAISWNIYYLNSIFNTQDFTKPKISYIVNNYKSVQYGLYKIFELYIMKRFLKSDNGIIFQSIEQSEIVSFFENSYDFTEMLHEGHLASIFLYSSNKEEIYNRSYMKLQWIFASVGALAEIFMHLFRFICSYFTSLTMNKKILNKIFDYDLIKNQNTENNKSINKSTLIKLDSYNLFGRDFSPNSRRISIRNPQIQKDMERPKLINNLSQEEPTVQMTKHLDKERLFEIIEKINTKEKRNFLCFNYKEMVMMLLCKKFLDDKLKQKNDLYEKSVGILDDYLDISYIIQKLEEFEKLKLICLTDEQLALFNLTAKDFCSLNNDKQRQKIFNRFKEYNKDIARLVNTLFNFKQKYHERKNLTVTDKRIFQLLREDLKE
jgi:hypothetical protein